MTVVEYLIVVPGQAVGCDSVEAFKQLLDVHSALEFDRTKVKHDNGFECEFAITGDEIKGKDQRFYHLKLSAPSSSDLDKFSELLRDIRAAMSLTSSQIETLWDDISFHYSRQGYELIHRIESLMRKLIANFMFVTVGKEWVDEASPSEIKKVLETSKRNDKTHLNALHRMDFIHLADFLLRPYAKHNDSEIYAQLKKATSLEEYEAVKTLLPESNWQRYFSSLVACADDYLKKRWDELYELRCKIAHNAIVTKVDFERVKSLVQELEVKLEEALKKLPQVTVPASEIQQVAENAVDARHTALGMFFHSWATLEMSLIQTALHLDWQQSRPTIMSAADYLFELGVLDESAKSRISQIRKVRNLCSHAPMEEISHLAIKSIVEDIQLLIGAVNRYHMTGATISFSGPEMREGIGFIY